MAKTARTSPFVAQKARYTPPASQFQARAASPGVVQGPSPQQRRAIQQLTRAADGVLRVAPAVINAARAGSVPHGSSLSALQAQLSNLSYARRSTRSAGLGAISTADLVMSPTMWGLVGVAVGAGATWAWLTLR